MSEWQPIETAPKDKMVVVARWRLGSLLWLTHAYDAQRLTGATHWMPLPEPPR